MTVSLQDRLVTGAPGSRVADAAPAAARPQPDVGMLARAVQRHEGGAHLRLKCRGGWLQLLGQHLPGEDAVANLGPLVERGGPRMARTPGRAVHAGNE